MPTYEYLCQSCGGRFDLIRSVRAYTPNVACKCGGRADRTFTKAPAVFGDYAAYDCPITGKRIEGKKEHEANLRKHGCRVQEPGEIEAFKRAKAAEESAFESRIEATAEEFVSRLDSKQQEQLGRELDSGADTAITRQAGATT